MRPQTAMPLPTLLHRRGLIMGGLAVVLGPAAALVMPPLSFDRPEQRALVPAQGLTLAGSLLTLPGPGPFPALVLVHGSGPARRDDPASIVHANAFLAQGFAVFSYDKRGSGGSGGDLELANYQDLAGDAAAAVRWLRTRSDIAPARIGLLGRSEGGWVAPLAALHDPALAFVVMSSGSAQGPRQQTLDWTRAAIRKQGGDAATAQRAVQAKSDLWDFYRAVASGGLSASDAAVRHKELVRRLGDLRQSLPDLIPPVLDPATAPRAKFASIASMIDHDPQPVLDQLRTPLLAMLGADDDVVEPGPTFKAIEKLHASGRDASARVLPGVGHPLLVMQGERIVGYAPGYLEEITAWARERVARVRP